MRKEPPKTPPQNVVSAKLLCFHCTSAVPRHAADKTQGKEHDIFVFVLLLCCFVKTCLLDFNLNTCGVYATQVAEPLLDLES
jgi:hypothetical protein